jgi:hypothetical protein
MGVPVLKYKNSRSVPHWVRRVAGYSDILLYSVRKCKVRLKYILNKRNHIYTGQDGTKHTSDSYVILEADAYCLVETKAVGFITSSGDAAFESQPKWQ